MVVNTKPEGATTSSYSYACIELTSISQRKHKAASAQMGFLQARARNRLKAHCSQHPELNPAPLTPNRHPTPWTQNSVAQKEGLPI